MMIKKAFKCNGCKHIDIDSNGVYCKYLEKYLTFDSYCPEFTSGSYYQFFVMVEGKPAIENDLGI